MEMGNSCLCRIRGISISILCLLINTLCCEAKSNTITQGQVLRDGETLVSADGSFEFGFFSPPNSTLRYVGIWYSNISVGPYVWVANRNAPIADRNGSFTIGYEGNLLVYNGTGKPVWSSNTVIFSNNYTAVLQNNGNFEIRGNYSSPGYEFTCWQSFDNPTDTYLPGMKVLVSERVGESKIFTSWKSSNDPSTGNFTMGVDPRAAPQVVIWEGSNNRRWRSGHFNGMKFTGVPTMSSFYYYGFKISNPDPEGNMYLSYDPQSGIQKFKFIISWDGYEKSLVSSNGGNTWSMLQSEPSSICDRYNTCGSNGYCMNSGCGCFKGFKPKHQEEWQNGNWSGGCVRKTELQCERNRSLIGQDGFLRVDGVKLPDFADLMGNVSDEQECEKQCSLNCSCTAYAFASGIGCMTWVGELIDIELFPQDGNKMYIRVASSELGSKFSGPKIAAIVLGGVLFVSLIVFLLWKFRAKLKARGTTGESSGVLTMGLRSSRGYSTDISGSVDLSGEGNLVQAPDLPLINYNLVALATNFFAQENKLGQGGFGPVYKGVLPGGQEIAVKKLSRKSGQGLEEFKNEIRLIAKLQHRNLVRILGCCVQGEEKILVYEYMPNKSLDSFIFDSLKQGQIDWKKRMKIIEGIARGLLYLHRDARCTIIHRDLKASNILLDQDMNPKISDFGMAKIFGGDQDRANTNRVVGTYGYMSPEYAMEGYFSDKSDVYSFGVLLLEVVTGRRNTSFRSSEHMSLIEYAWELWSEGKVIELADPSIRVSCTSNEVNRCIHIALLCVQDSAYHRPAMSHVVLWLESDSVALPIPKQPTMTLSSHSTERECQNGGNDVESKNNLTITMIVPR